ncbi:MAG TPA: hypothetical protein VM934_04245 [Pyrinomonadaceae bacterium]|jgi:hypothetical protein|nr:hypothetical protein [Pyrinomonadaceae bacterium]
MRKSFVYLAATIVFALALVFSQPSTIPTVKAADLQEKCDECNIRNFRQYEHCVEIHGLDDVDCSDQFNAGVVHCFRNFCEQ